jgi:type IV secretion system protein VirD4
MKNYAGHRLSPWLGHLMISRQETARPLLTAGEVMQLPPTDELVLVSACHPIRAKKARYYEDARLKARVLPPPSLAVASEGTSGGRPNRGADDWSYLPVPASVEDAAGPIAGSFSDQDSENSGIRRERRCLTTKRSWPKSRSPAQSLLSPMMSLTMTPSVLEHCGSASARWRDRPRLIPMMEFLSNACP